MPKKISSLIVVAIFHILFPMSAFADDRPNIVLIFADDFGRELLDTYGGSSYRTPNIDRLSKEGMTFQTCYSTPLCAPSRVMLMNGQYSFRSYRSWGEIDENRATFAKSLRDSGYQTAMAGKWHMGGWEETPHKITTCGFENYSSYDYAGVLAESMKGNGNQYWGGQIIQDSQNLNLKKYGPDHFSEYITNFIRNRDSSKPFLAYYAMNSMHRPFFPTPEHPDAPKNNESPPRAWLGSKGDAKNFVPMLTYLDKIVGRILDTLVEEKIDHNTIVIFTSDNGTDNVHEAKTIRSKFMNQNVAGGKYFPKELGTNVPLLVRWKGKITPGSKCEQLADLTDIYPTLCNLAKCEFPKETDGKSWLPIFEEQPTKNKEFIYSWGNFKRSSKMYKQPAKFPNGLFDAIRDEEWKYYSNGRLYNIKDDFLERQPIPPENNPSAIEARVKLKRQLKNLRSTQPTLW